jgi:hypothetical protein
MYLAIPIIIYALERLTRALRSSIKPVRILKVSVEHWINYEGFDILLFKFNQKFKLQHIHTAFKFQPANQGWCTWNSERIVVLLIISFGKYSKVRHIKEGGWKKNLKCILTKILYVLSEGGCLSWKCVGSSYVKASGV